MSSTSFTINCSSRSLAAPASEVRSALGTRNSAASRSLVAAVKCACSITASQLPPLQLDFTRLRNTKHTARIQASEPVKRASRYANAATWARSNAAKFMAFNSSIHHALARSPLVQLLPIPFPRRPRLQRKRLVGLLLGDDLIPDQAQQRGTPAQILRPHRNAVLVILHHHPLRPARILQRCHLQVGRFPVVSRSRPQRQASRLQSGRLQNKRPVIVRIRHQHRYPLQHRKTVDED